ncbi:hypothetical protein [Halorubrum amylolyticum]|uniref:hypothetical protein n=1 Tax=Halorubrum amylolyticum TaxID=2508724 RepID=UPI001009036E|nr:hypothetical protein [Halorubrum amylolyticum]
MTQNYQELLTEEGKEFIDKLSSSLRKNQSLDPLIEEYEITEFRGGSLGRRVLPLPDTLVQNGFLGQSDTETYFILKVSGKPLPHNYREIKAWEKACELGWEHESLFAPIHAWDNKEYKWLIMRRATPISPHQGDIAYLLSGQEYVYAPEAPKQMEDKLNDQGWTVEDVEMNVGIVDDGICMMDYGGVERRNDTLELPDCMQSEN